MWGDGGVRKACRLLRGGVDRNIDLLADAPDVGRRLLRGGVDRNVKALRPLLDAPGRLLRGGVDRNVAAVTQHIDGPGRLLRGGVDRNICADPYRPRSEEHTSELQSLMRISYAVFCLKKKTQTANILHNINNDQ